MTVEQMALAAVAALAGVVVVFWKLHLVDMKDVKNRLKDCENDRANLWREVTKLMGGPKTDP